MVPEESEPTDRRSAADVLPQAPEPPSIHVGRRMARCAARTITLLLGGHLHLRRDRIGTVIVLPDGRPYLVFRESTCDRPGDQEEVTLLVWFRLKGTGPEHPWRSWVFERESILNTVLYAGCPGFARKLWMVDRSTAAYAGLYTWRGRADAERYAIYITAVLRPLSIPGTVGSTFLDHALPH